MNAGRMPCEASSTNSGIIQQGGGRSRNEKHHLCSAYVMQYAVTVLVFVFVFVLGGLKSRGLADSQKWCAQKGPPLYTGTPTIPGLSTLRDATLPYSLCNADYGSALCRDSLSPQPTSSIMTFTKGQYKVQITNIQNNM